MRLDLRVYDYVTKHPFKTGFMLFFAGLGQYFNFWVYLVNRIRNIESPRRKLRRWILHEHNYVPQSIEENDLSEVTLPDKISHKLGLAFLKIDDELYYGVSFKQLFNIFKELGQVDGSNKKERQKFYAKSGYTRQANQKTGGISLKGFYGQVDDMYKEYVLKVDKEMSLAEFTDIVIQKMFLKIEIMREWEQRFSYLRMELARNQAYNHTEKFNEIVRQINIDDAESDIEIFVKEMRKNGFMMSLSDRIVILEMQRDKIDVHLNNYNEKQRKVDEFNLGKDYRGKIDQLKEKRGLKSDEINKIRQDYQQFYKKVETYD